ncbi:MAG: ABC transporter ATP-binding protein [Litorimonas sp.]
MTDLLFQNITVTGRVTQVDLHLDCGELVVILGPNGAGKTTLLKTALNLIKPDKGQVFYGSQDNQSLSPIERAKCVSYLPQIRPMAWPNIVRDIVALGRYSHGASLGRLKGQDKMAVNEALSACGLTHFSERRIDSLSGGEIARVHCARAFAAKAPLLIADEPVAALDLHHQFKIMDLIRDYTRGHHGGNGGALVVLHDINLAAKYADRLVWMKDGHILANGTVKDTLTTARLADIYGVSASINETSVQIHGVLDGQPNPKA